MNLVFQNGYKNLDYVVFNPLKIQLTNDKPIFSKIKINDSKFWTEIKSRTWSSNCRIFFVISQNQIVIGNTLNNDAYLCKNLSMQVFEEYMKFCKQGATR